MKVIFDLDGTLADVRHRLHHIEKDPRDWDAFYRACVDDEPIWPVVHMLRALARPRWPWAVHTHKVEIWTGRKDVVHDETLEWLARRCGIYIRYYSYRGQVMNKWDDLPDPHSDVLIEQLWMRAASDNTPDHMMKEEWLKGDEVAGNRGPIGLVFEDRKRVVDMWRRNGIPCCQVGEGDF